jgi:hypothetical protein
MVDLYDAIRGKAVGEQPEELVRQAFVNVIVRELGYPRELIMLEKQLSQLPHLTLSQEKIPDRRLDVICFAKGIHSDFELYPLLMVECKAVKLTPKVTQQVVSYNHYVKACFVAVVNVEEVKTGWYDKESKEYKFIDGLPSYQELLAQVK